MTRKMGQKNGVISQTKHISLDGDRSEALALPNGQGSKNRYPRALVEKCQPTHNCQGYAYIVSHQHAVCFPNPAWHDFLQ